MNRTIAYVVFSWMVAVTVIAGCESSFEVFGESDAYFSMFGYLDASADTQWVRVEGLQDSLINDTKPLDAEFSMTHLPSGRRVVWRDSLFDYSGGARAHNLWTDEPILPRETYRLDVVRSDGATSSAVVALPDTFPEPALDTFPFSIVNLPNSAIVCAKRIDLVLENVDAFAALQITYRVPTRRGTERTFSFSYISDAVFTGSGVAEVTLEWAKDLLEIATIDREIEVPQLLQLISAELLIAAAGPGWPDHTLPLETLALPGVATNVEQGLGFVGGVASRRIDVPIGNFRDVSCLE